MLIGIVGTYESSITINGIRILQQHIKLYLEQFVYHGF